MLQPLPSYERMSLQTKFKTHLVVKIECYISNGIGEWDAVLEMTNGSIEMPEVGEIVYT
jgi:hypothetical protein